MLDNTLTTSLDILNYLLLMAPKEVSMKLLQDKELSLTFAIHFFLSDDEGIRLQILEFYR